MVLTVIIAVAMVCGIVGGRASAGAVAGAYEESAFHVDSWTTREGLPRSSVITMTQTRDGYLWLGTVSGLVRFDGIDFTVFDESNTPGLQSSRIVHLFEDSRNNLWVGTETAGVVLIREGQAIPLNIGRGDREGRLVSATEDEHGAVWLFTADARLCRYNDGRVDVWQLGEGPFSFSRSVISESNGLVWAGPVWANTNWAQIAIGSPNTNDLAVLPVQDTLPLGQLDFMLASQQGGYWRMAEGRVQQWQGAALLRDFGPYPWLNTSSNIFVSAACEDTSGNLILGTVGAGAYWYDAEGTAHQIAGLSHSTVLSLCFDQEGNLWVGTDGGGLKRVTRSKFSVHPETRGWVVQSVAADDQGGLWIGGNYGELAHWSNNELTRYSTTSDPVPSVKSVFVDREHRIWAGTWGRGLFKFERDQFQRIVAAGLFQSAVVAIHQARNGALWLGMQEGLARIDEHGLKVYGTTDGLSQTAVRAIADDSEGTLWIGTAGGGLNVLQDGEFTVHRKTVEGLPSDYVSALYLDDDGVLWVGTAGGGLARLHQGRWTRYSTREGLTSNDITYLLEDPEGFLWLGSNAGLMRVSKADLNAVAQGTATTIACRSFVEADGLPTRECTEGSQPAACIALDGTLCFPTVQGLVTILPERLNPNLAPPPVAVESVMVEGVEQNTNALHSGWAASVVLPPGRELLEIRYTSLNLSASERSRRFRYRLEGHENDWIDAGNTRVARYSRLPHGEYTFRVTAANEDGLWNETGASFAVIVLPPFWRTTWFMTASVGTVLALIVGIVYVISTQRLQRQLALMHQQEALERERSRIARDLHDQLGANLTQVALLGELTESDKDEPEEVEAYAKQIANTARDTTRALDEIVWAANPANDTLDGLINYVCKYTQEYLAIAGLRHRFDVPSNLPSTPLQPEVRHNIFLSAKEAVNNVIKHAQATEVRVRLHRDHAQFTLEIEDNGRGPGGKNSEAARTRNGLRNMRKRMEDIGGAFSIEPGPNGGSIVRLTAPIQQT